MRTRTLLWRCALVSALLLAGQAFLPSSRGGMLRKALFDSGHLPLFMAFALILLRYLRQLPRAPLPLVYGLAALAVLVLGAATEYVQRWTPRDAEFMDFVHNLLGGGAALLAALALERRLRLHAAWRVLAALLALSFVTVALLPLSNLLQAYRLRDQSFPTLFDFEGEWESRFTSTRSASLQPVDASILGRDGRALRVRFQGSEWPALVLHEPVRDWSGYELLRFDCFCKQAMKLYLRIDDAKQNAGYGERFDRVFELPQGTSSIAIPLDEIASAPAHRRMNLARMHSLAFFTAETAEIVLDRIRLE